LHKEDELELFIIAYIIPWNSSFGDETWNLICLYALLCILSSLFVEGG
jgi:hypothetical protein